MKNSNLALTLKEEPPHKNAAISKTTRTAIYQEPSKPLPLQSVLSMILRASWSKKSALRRRIKSLTSLAARVLINQRQTFAYTDFLNSTPLLAQLLESYPRMYQKIYWPYLTNTLNCQKRLEVLMMHYEFVEKLGLEPIIGSAASDPHLLGQISGKSGALYEIRLAAVSTAESEGELTLQLWQQETLIYGIAFSIFTRSGSPVIGVGCLQGPSHRLNGLELIQQTTKDLHGLRPKNLMIRLVQQFGRECGCNQLILVGNQNLVVQNAINKGRMHANYDEFWLELGAVRQNDGDFRLSCEHAELNLEDIPSKKRSEARKRVALLNDAQAIVGSMFK